MTPAFFVFPQTVELPDVISDIEASQITSYYSCLFTI